MNKERLLPQGFLTEEIALFIRHRQARNKWNHFYEEKLRLFEKFCYGYEEGKYSSLNQEMINTWCAQRDSEKPSSCYVRSIVVSNFIEFLIQRGLTDCQEPVLPRCTHSNYTPHLFTEEELKVLFYELNNLPRRGKRKADYYRWLTAPVFFLLLLATGMRPKEALNLKKRDINPRDGVISLEVTKNKNHRYVVVDEAMLELLNEYDAKMDELEPNRVYFFPSPEGGAYGNSWVVKTFRIAKDKAGIPDARAYDLRHNYALQNINTWINEGDFAIKKLVYLMISMGHSSLDETKYYYHYAPKLADIVNEIEESGLDSIIPEADYGWKEEE